MKKPFSKTELYQILTGVFVACLLISNILAARTFVIADVVLPTAVIIFPIVYIVNDVLAELYGFQKTKKIVWLGFFLNLFAVLAYTIAMKLPAPAFATETAEAFAVTLGTTGRILVASVAAYLVGSLINAKVMEVMKAKFEKYLMARCVVSTLVGEGLDAIVFITIAFIGTMSGADLIVMIIAQATFKTVFEIIFYPATKYVINKAKTLAE